MDLHLSPRYPYGCALGLQVSPICSTSSFAMKLTLARIRTIGYVLPLSEPLCGSVYRPSVPSSSVNDLWATRCIVISLALKTSDVTRNWPRASACSVSFPAQASALSYDYLDDRRELACRRVLPAIALPALGNSVLAPCLRPSFKRFIS